MTLPPDLQRLVLADIDARRCGREAFLARLVQTIPTISYGAGPRSFLEANGHRADERLKLADLDAATRIVALSVAEILRA